VEGFDVALFNRLYYVGDSKTYKPDNTWGETLATDLTAAGPIHWTGDNVGVGATTVAYWFVNIDASIASQPSNHVIALLSLGVNDFNSITEATWISQYQYIVDAIHTRWPAVQIYIMRPWKRDYDAAADTVAGWIDTIVASRSFLHLGPDERVWLKGADNGATNTYDGVHYSAAGEAACAAVWKTVLGY
jgi:hypothetical protein